MEFKLVGKDVLALKGDALVVGVYKELYLSPMAGMVNKAMSSLLKDFLKDIHFEAEAGRAVFMPGHKEVKFKNIVVVGLGERDKLQPDTIRKAAAAGLKKARELKNKAVYFEVLGEETLGKESAQALTEGIILGNYQFKKYKKPEKEEIEIQQVYILAEREADEFISRGKILAEATNFTRDIVNEPGNVVRPADLAAMAQKLAQEYGLGCKIYDKNHLQKEGMNGILAVGQGSEHPPFFIHLIYKGENPQKKVVLIGKGITFDSGGLDLKPEKFMKTMKCDKSGACAVLGIMKAVAELKLNLEVHGLVPAAENMPSGSAFRPDDIIVFKNGKSVEIGNTDAEGRLILADALTYGSTLRPEVMVDMATLTGACMVALGRYTSGIFCSNEALTRLFQNIGQAMGEKFWPLPLDEELKEEIKGTFSDIKNIGSRYGGAITAALFLKEFVGEGVKNWVHLDIAGPAFLEKEWKYYAEGATGVPVRTIVHWLMKGADIGAGS